MLEQVSPRVGFFLSKPAPAPQPVDTRTLKSCLGNLELTEKQAEKLQVKSHPQISEYLEKCCLWVSANNSYQRTAEDLAALTGIRISQSPQQRFVHRQALEVILANTVVDNISSDGGKVRIRTSQGEESAWNDYKAVTLGSAVIGGYLKQNQALVDWVNDQP